MFANWPKYIWYFLNMFFRESLANWEYCWFHYSGTFDNHSDFHKWMGIDWFIHVWMFRDFVIYTDMPLGKFCKSLLEHLFPSFINNSYPLPWKKIFLALKSMFWRPRWPEIKTYPLTLKAYSPLYWSLNSLLLIYSFFV